MSTVVWTKGASTLTWDKGVNEVAPEDYESRVVTQELAGGDLAAYDLGNGPKKMRYFLFQGVTAAKKAEFESWRDTTVNGPNTTFTHTDNTQSPAEIRTVRMMRSAWRRMRHVTTTPTYEVAVDLRVEG